MATADELAEIRQRLEAIRRRFNTATRLCECCGLTQYDDRPEYQAAQQIDGAIGRVGKVLDVLDVLDEKD